MRRNKAKCLYICLWLNPLTTETGHHEDKLSLQLQRYGLFPTWQNGLENILPELFI